MNEGSSRDHLNVDLSIEEIEKVLYNLESDPTMPLDILDTDSNLKEEDNSESKKAEKEEDDDDEIQVVKADIYNFHGQTGQSLDQQVSEGILKFEYRDEDDDDILEIEVIDKTKDENEEITLDRDSDSDSDDGEEEKKTNSKAKSGDRIIICEKSGHFVPKNKFTEHKEENHSAKKRKFKEFSDGNFFMLAD